MTTSRRVYNASTQRDFCAEMDIMSMRKFQRTGGIEDESYLIADTFLIMFANQFVDSYIYETIDLIKEDKKLCRFEVKKVCNEINKWLDDFNKEYFGCMSRGSQGNISDMGNCLEDAFKKSMEGLYNATFEYVKENLKGNTDIITRILLCVMLLDWATTYMNSRLKDNVSKNPIIMKITWMSHEPLKKLVYKLDSLFGTPEKIKDIKIHAQFCKFQNLWCDAQFIADNLGDSQPVYTVDGSTCQMELRYLFNKKQISKN